MQEPEQEHSCALRALTLCDGTALETPDRRREPCLCSEVLRLVDVGAMPGARRAQERLQGLIEETMAPSQLRF